MAVWCQVWRGQVNARFAICHLPLPAPPTGGAVKITSKLSSFTVSRQARASQLSVSRVSTCETGRSGAPPGRVSGSRVDLTARTEKVTWARTARARAQVKVLDWRQRAHARQTLLLQALRRRRRRRPTVRLAGRQTDSRTDWLAGRPIGSLEGISAPRQRRAASAAAPASRAPWERLPRPCLCRCVCAHISSCRRRRSRRVSRRAKRERRQLNSTPPSS